MSSSFSVRLINGPSVKASVKREPPNVLRSTSEWRPKGNGGKNIRFELSKVFYKMSQSRPLFHLLSSFSNTSQIFTTNRNVKKCPTCIQCWVSNSQPLEHESPPITTRPGLSTMLTKVIISIKIEIGARC